ncbi:MAG: NAD(P)/FAD-dependent oxidoreductase, partial [Hyphomicrobiales bacterium]|nr:NAD(P)/FAD-dependent oxidoreductase [Hyphomicrobiales bacterium]
MSSRDRAQLVVIGNGMAGMRAVEELIARAPDRFEITVIGAEPHPNYNRILLSAVLAGDKTLDEIVINPHGWYANRNINLISANRVGAIDRAAHTLVLADGTALAYDKLLLATGSKPLAPPIPGLSFPNVRAFRDIADAEAMIAAAQGGGRAVVIGGGLLGLEAAWGLKRRGMSVALVHLMPTLMERQLDVAAGELLRRDLEGRGIAFFTNSQTEEIAGHDRAEAVVLADGRRIPADFVVLAVGIRPNIDLARAADLDVNRGILVGDDMATSDPDIYAVGECIEHNGQVFGLVAPIWDQAKVAGARLAGDGEAVYVPPPVFTSLKIT